MSESSALFQALLEFQTEVPTIKRDSVNPHFGNKYVSLDQLTQTVTPLLCKHGLVWSTFPCRVDGEPSLRYRLMHPASGESVEETMPLMLSKSDPQGQGSSLTYARRYAISAVLGLSAEDDDGNKGSRQQTPPPSAPQPTAAAAQPTERLASAKQRGLINARAGEHKMPASVLANVVLAATGNETRDFQSEEAAQSFLQRGLDRLPAGSVDRVLQGIEAEATPDD